MLAIELIGLSITGLLLFVIACTLQLTLRLLSGGALEAQLGVLAFGFLFYVCAAFVAAGTRQRPDHPHSLLTNVCVRAGFLCVGFLLWPQARSGAWIVLALGLVLLVHGGTYGFALLRRRALNALLRHRDAIRDTFIERFFRVRSPTYHALPIGGALGTLLGATVTRDSAVLLRHTAAGACAALALVQFVPLLAGALALAGSLTQSHSDPHVSVQAVGNSQRKELRVCAPRSRSPELSRQMDQLATALRRVLLVNQLQRTSAASLALASLWYLEFSSVPAKQLLLPLIAATVAFTLAPYVIGQRTR